MDTFHIDMADGSHRKIIGTYVVKSSGVLIVINHDDPDRGPQVISPAYWRTVEHVEPVDFDYVAGKIE